jgi:hypothetical protein
MTRFIHDQFAKDYLEELLSPFGEVKSPRPVRGERREIDVWFAPTVQSAFNPATLGLLGQLAATSSLFEPFRNPATPNEICDCLLKLLEVRGEVQRQANRNQTRLTDVEVPQLWILTPTASAGILEGFRAKLDEENWLRGIYFLAPYLRTAIVAIHQLPRTPETLWLRILGRGRVQQQAIDELDALPADNLFRANALELLFNLRTNLEISQNIEEEDRELIMRLSPLYQERLSQATQSGVERGERLVVENLLKVRFGALDAELSAIIEPVLALTPEEFTPLLLQLSREELLARFRSK